MNTSRCLREVVNDSFYISCQLKLFDVEKSENYGYTGIFTYLHVIKSDRCNVKFQQICAIESVQIESYNSWSHTNFDISLLEYTCYI